MPHRFFFNRMALWAALSFWYQVANTFQMSLKGHAFPFYNTKNHHLTAYDSPHISIFRLRHLLASLDDDTDAAAAPTPVGGKTPVGIKQPGDIEVLGGQFQSKLDSAAPKPVPLNCSIPPPLHLIADVNVERRSVVYEVVLGRDLGIEIVQGNGAAVVGQVRAQGAPSGGAQQTHLNQSSLPSPPLPSPPCVGDTRQQC